MPLVNIFFFLLLFIAGYVIVQLFLAIRRAEERAYVLLEELSYQEELIRIRQENNYRHNFRRNF